MTSITSEVQNVFQAKSSLLTLSDQVIQTVLQDLIIAIQSSKTAIFDANRKDLDRLDSSSSFYDRLLLDESRIDGITSGIQQVIEQPYDHTKIFEQRTMTSGLSIKRVRVPFGVVAVIFESRPNVIIDVFSLCFKTRNACILKGGKEAAYTTKKFFEIITSVLKKNNLNPSVVYLLGNDRSITEELLTLNQYVDLVIPRGSERLINYVRTNSSIPTIETGAGVVHTYFDEFGDIEKGKSIICNAKTRRPSVCNSLDTLILHASRLADMPQLLSTVAEKQVTVFADEDSYKALEGTYPASLLFPAHEEHYGKEFLSLTMAVRTVQTFEKALAYISDNSSRHSEAIVTEDKERMNQFLTFVDAAAVYANTSTAFTDGGEFGLGAEIGISTQKMHARGPMGLEALTSYKWVVTSDGAIRE